MDWLKKFFLIILLIAVIVGSFWVSFLIGKRMLLPAKKLPESLTPPQINSIVAEPVISDTSLDISIEVETSIPKNKPIVIPESKVEIKKIVKPVVKKVYTSGTYKVQVGAFGKYSNAKGQVSNLKKKGYNASISKYGKLWRVLAGSFSSQSSANKLVTKLKASGFDAVTRRK